MVEVLLDHAASWLSGHGPEAAVALRSRGVLTRNLADFPFEPYCTDDEKQAIEDRLLGVLDNLGFMESGQYISLSSLDERECRFLLERGLITERLVRNTGPRGVYVSKDQSLTVMVNEDDHFRIQILVSGLQPNEVWNRLDSFDSRLDVALDYAFDERLGYLTGDITRVGTGLKLDVVLHLPALYLQNKLLAIEQHVREQNHLLEAMYGSLIEAKGDLYVLQNSRTLGRSEEEIAFHLQHLAEELLSQEKNARQAILSESPRTLEDRIGRALGTARGARLLEYDEGLGILSALRLGLALDLANGYNLQQLNELMIESQPAHIETKKGQELDDLSLSKERSDLFRARFA